MRTLLALALAVIASSAFFGCKGKGKQGEGSGATHGAPGDAAPIVVDWAACDIALGKAAAAQLDARPQIVIDGCHVCGDWTPLMRWNTPHPEGGPKRTEIERALQACGYCDGNAKMRFLGTLDKARGTDARTPWRQLGDVCREQVSAIPDSRFVNAPFYALDRIARAASAHGGQTANLLAALELPLPALTVSGTGVSLPELDTGVTPKVGTLHITVLADSIHIGKLPRARLTASGVAVELGPDGYPGTKVELAELGGALMKLVGDDHTNTITILAPHAMPAEKLVPIIVAASTVAPIYLAATAHESPEGWQLPGAIPIALEGGGVNPIVVTGEMSVQNLAAELAKRVATKANRVGVTGH